MSKIKVYVPSYKRENDITTHQLFLDNPMFDVHIVVNTEEDKIAYGDKGCKILVSGVKGIANTRQWIYDLHKEDEWFISADDDIKNILVNKDHWNMDECEKYNYVSDKEFFFSKIPEIIEEADRVGARTIGGGVVNNSFFNKKKFKYTGHIMNTLVFWKKGNDIDWSNLYKDLDSMEEMNITAQHHLQHGKVLRVGYVNSDAGHYQEGGIGGLDTRLPKKRKDSAELIRYYQGFFREKGDGDVSCRIHDLKKLQEWRLYMIIRGRLGKEKAIDILGKEDAKKFYTKYKL